SQSINSSDEANLAKKKNIKINFTSKLYIYNKISQPEPLLIFNELT
ncbi:MAG: hypothetical protein CFH34_00970, partial [Alphaproteobacteria bacterium MarineAlpha9_Bin4]